LTGARAGPCPARGRLHAGRRAWGRTRVEADARGGGREGRRTCGEADARGGAASGEGAAGDHGGDRAPAREGALRRQGDESMKQLGDIETLHGQAVALLEILRERVEFGRG